MSSKSRQLADLLDANGDVKSASLDNVPASDDASALTTGTLPAARIASGAITNVKLGTDISADKITTGTLPAARYTNTVATKASVEALSIELPAANLTGTINSDRYTDTNTVYTHPTSAGNKHIPSGGSANQVLTYSASGTASWQDAAGGGGILQAKSATYDGHASIGGTFTSGHLSVNITPKKADSSYLFMAQCFFGYSNHDVAADIGFDVSGAAPGGTITPEGSSGGDSCFAISGIGTNAAISNLDDWSIGTLPAHFLWTPSSNLGTNSRTFQVLSRRRGSAGSIIWNQIGQGGSDARALTPISVLTVFEIDSGVL